MVEFAFSKDADRENFQKGFPEKAVNKVRIIWNKNDVSDFFEFVCTRFYESALYLFSC